MDRYFTSIPRINEIIKQFQQLFNIEYSSTAEHHDISGATAERIFNNSELLKKIFVEREIFGKREDSKLYNIYTNKELPSDATSEIINRDKLGAEIRDNFIKERLNSNTKLIWDTIHKCKIRTFSTAFLKVAPTSKEKALKAEKQLLQRLIFVSRSRSQFDLEEGISRYEFCEVPPSLFKEPDKLWLATDISKVMRAIETFVNKDSLDITEIIASHQNRNKVLVVDAMAEVHSIPVSKKNNLRGIC